MSDYSQTYPFASTNSSDPSFSMHVRTTTVPLDLQRIKKASGMGFVVFSLVFIAIAQWFLFPTFLTGLFRTTLPSKVEHNPAIVNFLEKEGKLKITSYTVVNSGKPFAAIGGFPGFPRLYLSQNLLDTFTPEEMHYVLLHEVGHVNRQHGLREILLMIAVISMVWSLFAKIQLWSKPYKTQMVVACIAGIVLGIIMIQFERIHEYEADYFAIEHLENPQGMITAAQKLRAAWGAPEHQTLIRELFYRGVPYDAKVAMASGYTIPKSTIIRPVKVDATPEPLLSAPAANVDKDSSVSASPEPTPLSY
ncbi:MAG: M48 family metalloprotease [Candidatus Woesebacteria bacterium]